MAWTQTDLDALDRALASGQRRVRYEGDGEVEYRSVDEMLAVRRLIVAALGAAAGTPPVRTTYAAFRKD